ncbi:17-beta-hydroxysteroid dehydrogenase type 3 isoform X2 [Corythoichthys intestinalis]|uniref:17-beta-hydroxysteroid dehydrogenase type 3 isoform X2 n=1 Tax=Corythoichthys intestinalis TaxID=161448 RepID=UPI0025A67719|nr:17-beta-hydroxysteroid dehydrogenase type 3 isoform X2 [Corythoichthys intestinalis]XP_061804679.1 17-beta-hydroxysteroid dehydrogenase type 3-like [Nerophis lumbriciformis]
MKSLMEWFFTSLGTVVVIYYGVKLFLFSRMLLPKRWFPLPKSFFLSMGEWAVVTGASEGIGRQYAFALAEHGMNVVIMSRTKVNLDKVAREISETTHRMVKVVVADFTKDNIFTDIEEQLKYLDIGVLVNNVGMVPSTVPRRFLEEEDLDQIIMSVINCNVKTMVKMCKIILPGMENRRKGVILNIASGVASIPFPMYSLYAASKIFVERFSQGLQAEYKDKGVIIQAVAPFGVSTRMVGYQQINAFMLSPRDFVRSSLQYIRAGDKTYGSICHMFLGWLLLCIPLKILHTEAVFQGLQNYVERQQAEKRCSSVIRDA